MQRKRTEQKAGIGGPGRSARVDKADHRVIVKVMLGDMLENSVSDLDGGDDFHFHVAGFCVPRTDASGALAMDAITRITGGAESLHLACKTVLDVAISDNDHAFHAHGVHKQLPVIHRFRVASPSVNVA